MRYWQHGETGRVVATETELVGEWYEIEAEQYEEALHPLTPANTVLQADMSCACPLDEFGLHQMPALADGTCPTCRKPYR